MSATSPVGARFDDLTTGRAWVFAAPQARLVARSLDEVADVLSTVQAATDAGAWAYGYVSYEAAAAFDSALATVPPEHPGPDDVPLAWFALTSAPAPGPTLSPAGRAGEYVSGPWTADWSAGHYTEQVARVQAAIAAGEVYQCNLTTRLRGSVRGSLAAFYADLAWAQGGAHNALLDVGRHAIVSASPELFFEWTDRRLITRPMKGTLPRGDTTAADERQRQRLRTSAKERAENLMIVDLLRNDLSRVAELGSVRVEQLFRAERYETVWQLTSTVTATPAAATTLLDVFAALFPCGSVTGAPKPAAMALSAALEPSPRGVYCGAVGMVAPPGAEFRARFHVAIRTAVVEPATGVGVYGSGGGITWGSHPADEYDEMVLKAAVLGTVPEPFALLETMRYDPASGIRHLDRHLARLIDSARYFGYPAELAPVRAELTAQLDRAALAGGPQRVRLLLARDGRLSVEFGPLPTPSAEPLALAVDDAAGPPDRWCRHKTTRRHRYESAAARHPDADDVILLDAAGLVVETTRANVAARIAGRWYTPPLSTGCLPGVERAVSIAAGRLAERKLTTEDLRAAEAVAVLNSLRGWQRGRLSG